MGLSDHGGPHEESTGEPENSGEARLSPAGEGDKAMGTVQEDGQDEISPMVEGDDRGLAAIEPILREGDQPADPGLPQAEVAIPPAGAMLGTPLFSPAAFQAPGPAEGLPEHGLLRGAREHPADPQMLALIDEARVNDLWARIDRAFAGVNQFVPSLPVARQLLDLLKQARNELLAGRDHFEEAERFVGEVEYRVARLQVVKASNQVSFGLLVYELVWFGLLVWGLLALGSWVRSVLTVTAPAVAMLEDVGVLVDSVLWGGVGGLVGALYALWRHTAELQDFDRQYSMWYLTNPIMGLILGAFTFLIIRAGLFSLTSGGGEITSPYFIYVMAWIVGFQQNVAYDLVRRVLGIFKVGEKAEPSEYSGPK